MKRSKNETYQAYKLCRAAENRRIDRYLRGRYIWWSAWTDSNKKKRPIQGTMKKGVGNE